MYIHHEPDDDRYLAIVIAFVVVASTHNSLLLNGWFSLSLFLSNTPTHTELCVFCMSFEKSPIVFPRLRKSSSKTLSENFTRTNFFSCVFFLYFINWLYVRRSSEAHRYIQKAVTSCSLWLQFVFYTCDLCEWSRNWWKKTKHKTCSKRFDYFISDKHTEIDMTMETGKAFLSFNLKL